MKPPLLLPVFFVLLASFQAAGAASSPPHATLDAKGPVVAASVSHRVSKPGQRLELLITVRKAEPPVSALPECPAGLELINVRKPQHLIEAGEDVWLLRFGIVARSVGTYEIPPVRVLSGSGSVATKPLILHVAVDAKPPLPDARELALTTDIPLALAREVVKNYPPTAPAPVPSPTPVPADGRPFSSRLISSIGRAFLRFWNYPGK